MKKKACRSGSPNSDDSQDAVRYRLRDRRKEREFRARIEARKDQRGSGSSADTAAKLKQKGSKPVRLLIGAICEKLSGFEGWVSLPALEEELADSGVYCEDYGYGSLSALFDDFPERFEVMYRKGQLYCKRNPNYEDDGERQEENLPEEDSSRDAPVCDCPETESLFERLEAGSGKLIDDAVRRAIDRYLALAEEEGGGDSSGDGGFQQECGLEPLPNGPHEHLGRFCYCDTVENFLRLAQDRWLDTMVANSAFVHPEPPNEDNITAWADCFGVMQESLGCAAHLRKLYICFEYVIPNRKVDFNESEDAHGKRVDVLLISEEKFAVLEFKQYSKVGESFDFLYNEAWIYGYKLRRFHVESQDMGMDVLLVPTKMSRYCEEVDGVIFCSPDLLGGLLADDLFEEVSSHRDIYSWLLSPYDLHEH